MKKLSMLLLSMTVCLGLGLTTSCINLLPTTSSSEDTPNSSSTSTGAPSSDSSFTGESLESSLQSSVESASDSVASEESSIESSVESSVESSSDSVQLPEKTPVLSILNKTAEIELGNEYTLLLKEENLTEAIVVTSSAACVEIKENNLLYAVGVGEATITVTSGEASDSFVVAIVNNVMPVVGLDGQPDNLFVGDTYQLKPYVIYAAESNASVADKLYDLEFTYSVEDEDVVSVSEEGVITALATGATDITVTTTYKLQTVSMDLRVSVVSVDGIMLNVATLALQTKEGENTATLTAEVWENNQLVENPALVWTIENDDKGAFAVDNGVVTANKFGTATVKVAYNEKYATCEIVATRGDVQETDVSLEIDRRAEQTLPLAGKIDGISADTDIVTITDADGRSLLTDGKLNGELLTSSPNTPVTLYVGTETDEYAISVNVYSLLIANAEDLKAAHEYVRWEGKLAYGDFKLINDVDLSGVNWDFTYQIGYLADNDFAYFDGFAGTFDGNGKKIKNLTISDTKPTGYDAPYGGLFYELANDSYVHDIIFENVAIKGHASGVIANAVMGGTLENIEITLSEVHQGYAGVGTSAILGNVLNAGYFGTVSVKNVTVIVTADDIAEKGCFAAIGYVHNSVDATGLALYKEKITLENVVVVGTDKLFMYGNGEILSSKTELDSYVTTAGAGVKIYATVDDFANGEEIRQYVVTYDSNGGSEVASTSVTRGKKLEKPTDPTKAEDENYTYTFAGWYNGDTPWNFDVDTVTDDITLTARWIITEKGEPLPDFDNITATVSYDADQSTGIDFQAAIGNTYGNVAKVYKADKTTEVGATLAYALNEASATAEDYYVVTDTDQIILVQATKWSQLVYAAADMASLGQYEYSPENNVYVSYIKFMEDIDFTGLTYDNTTPIGHNAPTYGFFGWQGVIEGNGKTITGFRSEAGKEFISRMGKGAIVRNLNFAEASVGGGDRALLTNFLGGGTFLNVNISVKTEYDGAFNAKTAVFAKEIPYASGYWNEECVITLENVTVTRSNTNTTDTKQAVIVCLTSGDYPNLSLEELKTRLVFKNVDIEGFSAIICDFITGNESTAVGVVNATNIGNYATVDENCSFGSVPVTKYEVTFDSQGGNSVSSEEVEEGGKVTKPTDPTKAEDENYTYTFAGWYNGDTPWNFDVDTVSGTLTLTARWTATPKTPTGPDFENVAATVSYDADQSTGIDFQAAIGNTYGNVAKVYKADKTTEVGATLAYALNEASATAEDYYVVTDTDQIILVQATKWSQLVYTAADLKNLSQYETNPSTHVYLSYIKVMENITFTETDSFTNADRIGKNVSYEHGNFGWQGVLEGNGKTITGFKTADANTELIAKMGKGAIVRNITFADATVGGGDRALLVGFLGGGTFLNVNISVKTNYDGAFNAKTSVIAKEIPGSVGYMSEEGITFENVAIARSNTNSTDTKQAAIVCLTSGYNGWALSELKEKLVMKNVDIEGFSAIICDFITGNESTAVGVVNATNIANYATVDENCSFGG